MFCFTLHCWVILVSLKRERLRMFGLCWYCSCCHLQFCGEVLWIKQSSLLLISIKWRFSHFQFICQGFYYYFFLFFWFRYWPLKLDYFKYKYFWNNCLGNSISVIRSAVYLQLLRKSLLIHSHYQSLASEKVWSFKNV